MDMQICIEMLKQMYSISDSEIDVWIKKKQKRKVKKDDKK